MSETPFLSISVVRHNPADRVERLLESLREQHAHLSFEVLLTENNAAGHAAFKQDWGYGFKRFINRQARSFAANHNAAFQQSAGKVFCILNPRLQFERDVFSPLLADLAQGVGDVLAPFVVDENGQVQDNARRLPHPIEILLRGFLPRWPRLRAWSTDLENPAWLTGMFLLMRRESYAHLGGMDEGYRMYFEDVDFGCRARLAGYKLAVVRRCRVQHRARQASRRNPKLLFWHLKGAWRFFNSPVYRLARQNQI